MKVNKGAPGVDGMSVGDLKAWIAEHKAGPCLLPVRRRLHIYVQSQAAGERVLASVTQFLEGRLKLRVNRAKSAAAVVSERKFLGHRILPGGRLPIADFLCGLGVPEHRAWVTALGGKGWWRSPAPPPPTRR